MITTNVFQRVFFIKGADYGTAFTIDYEGRQYLITAKHIVPSLDSSSTIQFLHEDKWKTLQVKMVGACSGEVDIVVLAPQKQLSPVYELPPTSGGLVMGQDVYFVGYPYKMWANIGELNRGIPFPFVKKGAISSMFINEDKAQIFYIDAINNPGFSGGPIVFSTTTSNAFNVCAVVSKFKIEFEPVLDKDGNKTEMTCTYNTGFLVGYGIKHAIAQIERNPIGFCLMKQS